MTCARCKTEKPFKPFFGMNDFDKDVSADLKRRIAVGSVWEGRSLTIRIRRVDGLFLWVERLDLPEGFRDHRWKIRSMEGLRQLR